MMNEKDWLDECIEKLERMLEEAKAIEARLNKYEEEYHDR